MTQDEKRWISVEDELPKSGERVQIARISESEFYWANFCWYQSYSERYSVQIQEPTHWRRRPAPPEVDDE
jgi:hypothetical protein